MGVEWAVHEIQAGVVVGGFKGTEKVGALNTRPQALADPAFMESREPYECRIRTGLDAFLQPDQLCELR